VLLLLGPLVSTYKASSVLLGGVNACTILGNAAV
jgi:hypothetical protein